MPANTLILRAHIDREIHAVWRTLLLLHGLRTGHASELVLQRLAERVDESLQTTLFLLATLLHEDRLAAVARLLTRVGGGRQRVLLLEALESLLPPAERAWFQPLLEDVGSPSLAAAAAAALGRDLLSFEEALRDAQADEDTLTQLFLAHAAGVRPQREGTGVPPLADGGALRDDRDYGEDAQGTDVLSKVDIILHLRSLELFAGLTTRQLSHLAEVVREERYSAGATVVRQGDFEDCMYLIVSGEVRITRHTRTLARRGARDFFGEMSLFDGETRAATVTAVTRVRVLRLERRDLFQVMDEQPGIAITICQTLSRRVRELIDREQGGGEGGNEK
jgi:hypothetical protein